MSGRLYSALLQQFLKSYALVLPENTKNYFTSAQENLKKFIDSLLSSQTSKLSSKGIESRGNSVAQARIDRLYAHIVPSVPSVQSTISASPTSASSDQVPSQLPPFFLADTIYGTPTIEFSQKPFNRSQEAISLFALLHTDFMGFEHGDGIIANSILTLNFLIQELEALKEHPRLQKKKQQLQKLLDSYKSSFVTAIWKQRLYDQSTNPQAYILEKRQIRSEMIDWLKKGNNLSISTGYVARPAGHEIPVYLTPIQRNGRTFIRGEFVNRGEGSSFHTTSYTKEGKPYEDHWAELEEVPVEDLEKSSFFDYLLDLSIVDLPNQEGMKGLSTEKTTNHCIQDFYEVLLPTWPGNIGPRKKFVESTSQRSGSCTSKPYISELKDFLLKDSGFIKLHLTKRTLDLVLEYYE
ncbi:MAG: hypothetical protein HKM07_06220, partial [Chlamydiae bacterium]|nr:hypothetical protein [Chlamydiota bacterium]